MAPNVDESIWLIPTAGARRGSSWSTQKNRTSKLDHVLIVRHYLDNSGNRPAKQRINPEDLRENIEIAKWVESSKWGTLCEDMFDYLAETDEHFLCKLILSYSNMDEVDLAHAAYALANSSNSEKIIHTLLSLLNHEQPIVREGAIHGLANKQLSKFARYRLSHALTEEDNPILVEEIQSLLDQ
ncbi:HEAT repeat domain-containing protein [Deinococcus knuensis]|nr:HEAT repeat domain-containing protein [Deinococcus knuensis]